MTKNTTIAALAVIVLIGVVAAFALRPTAPASETMRTAPLPDQAVRSDTPESAEVAGANAKVLSIAPGAAEARFVIDEVLRGSPNTVAGSTDQVTGQILVNPAQPADTYLSPVTINARTLATDDAQRNNAMRRFILETDEHEYITFTPTDVIGLPASTTSGQAYTLRVPGELTIREVTQAVVFDATVTPVSDSELRGRAATTIRYGDWGIRIPQIPFVAGVADEVRLELDFVAN
jgi:polyisoprenoid-binding protein YceI